MSEQNVELHRRGIEAFNAHDVEGFLALSDPQSEFHSQMTIPGGVVYHGHDGLRRYFRDMEDAWGDEARIEPEGVYFKAYPRREDALTDLGISEDALEPIDP